MKRGSLLRHLRTQGCYLKREGREHSISVTQRLVRLKQFLATRKYPINWRRRYVVVSPYPRFDLRVVVAAHNSVCSGAVWVAFL